MGEVLPWRAPRINGSLTDRGENGGSKQESAHMFEVVAYPPHGSPFIVLADDDKDLALRVFRRVAIEFEDAGYRTTVGVDRRDPTAPQGWREIASNRDGLVRPVFPRD